jgi:iron complex transport system substrate-binding protein
MRLGLISALFLAVLLSSCGGRQTASADGGDTVPFRYAQLLQLVRHDGYTVATIRHPWRQDAVLHRYVLVPADAPAPDGFPEGTVIRTPLRRSVVFTTVHCSLLSMLHREASVAGVADLKYIKAPYVQEGVAAGRIVDCGDGMSPVIEKIIDLHPDALLLSPFENSGGYGQLEEIDIPIVECAEYMEPSPLGRAEWVRFYGLLYGCEHEADSLFALVDSSYHALRHTVTPESRNTVTPESRNPVVPESRNPDTAPKTSVLVDKVTGSVWYVPGGRSTIGQMLSDAGARYPWASDDRSGSIALPFETVLERAGDCDVWLLRYSGQQPLTRQQLLSEHRGYNQFRSFREGRVYGCNVEQSMFYEDSPFRPDLLLSDFIKILHPDIPDLPALRYYHKVE